MSIRLETCFKTFIVLLSNLIKKYIESYQIVTDLVSYRLTQIYKHFFRIEAQLSLLKSQLQSIPKLIQDTGCLKKSIQSYSSVT